MPNFIEIGGGSRKFSKKLVDLTRNDPIDTDPCGTPEVTWILSDVAPSSMTRCVRDVKNEFIQFSTILCMP